VLLDQVVEIDGFFLGNVMDGEVLRLGAYPSGAFLEDRLLVCFFEDEDVEDEGESAHDAGYVFCPAPAEVGLCDEGADDGGDEGTYEDECREACYCYASSFCPSVNSIFQFTE